MSRGTWRRILVALPVAASVSAVACRPDENPPVATDIMRDGVDMVLTGMETYLTRRGIRRALLKSDTAEFVSENEIHMRPVELTFYDVDGSEASVITADFGIFYEATEDMEAQGSIVVLDRRDDQRLETERLRYVASEDRMYGDAPFTLWSDDGATVLRGSAFESDPGLDSVTVLTPSGRSERGGLPGRTPAGAPPDTAGTTPADAAAAVAPDSTGLPDTSAVADTVVARDTRAAADTLVAPDTTVRPDTSAASNTLAVRRRSGP